MPLAARASVRSSITSGFDPVDPSVFPWYSDEADDHDNDEDTINHNETWPISKSTGSQLTFERLDYMGKQVERMKNVYASASVVERRNSFLQSVGASWEFEEESFIDDAARQQMEEHFAKSCRYDQNDIRLLEMLGPECEESLFKDQQRVLAYFRHKAAVIERHHGFRFGAEHDKPTANVRRGHREAVVFDSNAMPTHRPSSGASSSSSSSSSCPEDTPSAASSPKSKQQPLKVVSSRASRRKSRISTQSDDKARSSIASRSSTKGGKDRARFASNASRRSVHSDGEDDSPKSAKDGPRPSSTSGKPPKARTRQAHVNIQEEQIDKSASEEKTEEEIQSLRRRMSRRLSTRKDALPALLQSKRP
mmetsp:Transcript_25592/g.41031  ORF Transcript_25592/g.41031 Transcript_25592/m.41031 type:complete len:364 (-) Transcript_25592:6-1097(-)